MRWSGLKTGFEPGEVLVMPRLSAAEKTETARILIADDDEMIPEMLRAKLEMSMGDHKLLISTTSSAEEALEILCREPFDLLITDYDFSRGQGEAAMNGLALLRSVTEERIVVTSILMTGYGNEEVAKNAILLGASDYLTKPALKGLVEVTERGLVMQRQRLEQAALRNAARLLEISSAFNNPEGAGQGAEQVVEAIFREIDADLVWLELDGDHGPLRRVISDGGHSPPTANVSISGLDGPRQASSEERQALFDGDEPEMIWLRPLQMQRPGGDEAVCVGTIGVMYKSRAHRFHPGRRQTLEVIAHHAEGVIAQRILRRELERNFSETIQVLVQALEQHDEYTAGHSDWVSVYARLGAAALNWAPREVARAGHAGLLHDIGKVRMDSSVINHPGKLTDEQFEHFKQHPAIGAEMLKPLHSMQDILPAVGWHHERYEGGGYPSGVPSEMLPALARLMCIADSYDAMTSHRAYRRARSHQEALSELWRCAGSQFDPTMVPPFIVALAGFRRMVWNWGVRVISDQRLVRPSELNDIGEQVLVEPWSDQELGLVDPETADERRALCLETTLRADELQSVFLSLEEALIIAAQLFLRAIADSPSNEEELAAAMEGMAKREDHRLQRLLASIWVEMDR